ncbi:MAG TPA: methyltransferase domain-containing protein [Solirubrobacteraceae bacterium]|jgi:SAM-dependent methyltransferase
MTVDPDEFRATSRERWEQAAKGWEERRVAHQRDAQPVSVWLVEHVEPQPGYRILELAAGVGDTGLLAAELVQPGGSVLITDGAQAMVEAAKRRAEELGIDNVEVRQMEAEWLDLPAASVDGVVCRWGYMLLADPGAALRETRRVLRPGGRVALAAWTDYDANPWFTIAGRALGEAPPAPGNPGPFAFAEPGHIEALLQDAGFDEIHVEALDFAMRMADRDEYFEHQKAMSTRLREALAALTPAQHTRVRDEIDVLLTDFVQPDGSVVLPARTWVARALA